MANPEHLNILKQGVKVWNEWRKNNRDIKIDLREADLSGSKLSEAKLTAADLTGADLTGSDLSGAELYWAKLFGANLGRADLHEAALMEADLREADLTGALLIRASLLMANLTGADLTGADLYEANLREANLRGANLEKTDLSGASLVQTNLAQANLSGARIFGVSAWKVNLEGTIQSNLIISDEGEPIITVDNLEIAQFVYLLLHNEKLRDVIDTIGKKAVLILGRFTPERKAILEALREALRQRNYIPILFDFEKPTSKDFTETIVTLAHLSRFIIADITDAKSIPQELQAIVPNLPSVAVQPLIHVSQREYAMFEHFKRYPWVLPLHEYDTEAQLIADLPSKIIQPAEDKANEMRPRS